MAGEGLIYIMDMESSLADSIARRIVDMDQYFLYRKHDMNVDVAAEIETYKEEMKGIIISGSGRNVNSKKRPPPSIPDALFMSGLPMLCICYGMQYVGHRLGAPVVRCWDETDPSKRTKKDKGEQGPKIFYRTDAESILFRGLGTRFPVWMKHNWMLESLPEGWTHTGSTAKCPIAAMERGNIYCVQYHPEPYNSLFGKIILHNFLTLACGVETPFF